MGSVMSEGRGRDADDDEVTVLVTGFEPFKAEFPVNPSWEIASSLPDYIPASDGGSGSVKGNDPDSSLPRIRVVRPPTGAIRVSYDAVRSQVPGFWDDPGRPFDFVVHIGMALPQKVYQIERRGHRDHYRLADVDGKFLEDEKRHAEEGERWIWHGVPHELLTDLDIDTIYDRWMDRIPKLDEDTTVKISENAGFYLCDFIYFSSMAHLWKQGRPRKVIFFHVPAFSDEKTLETGKELAIQLIRSIVETETRAARKR